VVLEVTDDGRGFDTGLPGGAGLRGMQERARLVGAELEVSSRPGATAVRLGVPVAP
jgi:signal transduction histidine kinase